MSIPKVLVLSLGGTIAMAASGQEGVTPLLGAQELVSAVPDLARGIDLEARSFRRLPGAHLSVDDIVELAAEINAALRAGTAGVVITQGTDTLEETAFLLDLLIGNEMPVVVTGAMRHPAQPGTDGPANLLAAVQVAASEASRGLGTVVVINDEIHAARFVRKTHTSSPAAFTSVTGPIGWVSEGFPRILARPAPMPGLPGPLGAGPQPVALLTVTLDDDDRLVRAVKDLGYSGLVVEALGAGHVPAGMATTLQEVAAAIPVLLASRAGQGAVFRRTYGFSGSERDLFARGLISAGWLDGPKARALLILLLRAGAERDAITSFFNQYGGDSMNITDSR